MSVAATNVFPALHNAMWPGLVGKGPDSEPPIDLETMLDLTAATEVDGVRFDGVDLFLSLPHTDIDSSDDDLARLADKLASKGLLAGSLVAPVWPPTGGGSAMGDDDERGRFLTQVKKACRIGQKLRDLKIRKYGVVRIDSAASAGDWAKDPEAQHQDGSPTRSARPATSPKISASGWPPKARSAGPACIVGGATCSCWKWWTAPRRSASRPTWRTPCCSPWATTRRKTACCPAISTGRRPNSSAEAYAQMAAALRPWTIDFHVAQNDGTVKGRRLARQDRPALPAARSQRQARYRPRRRRVAARRRRAADPRLPAHLLGRLHVPQCGDARSEDLERRAAHHDRGARRARVELT